MVGDVDPYMLRVMTIGANNNDHVSSNTEAFISLSGKMLLTSASSNFVTEFCSKRAVTSVSVINRIKRPSSLKYVRTACGLCPASTRSCFVACVLCKNAKAGIFADLRTYVEFCFIFSYLLNNGSSRFGQLVLNRG